MIGRRHCSEGASLRSFSWQLDAIAIDVGSQDVLLGDDRSLLDELGRLRPALQSCGLRGWRGTASRTAWNASLGCTSRPLSPSLDRDVRRAECDCLDERATLALQTARRSQVGRGAAVAAPRSRSDEEDHERSEERHHDRDDRELQGPELVDMFRPEPAISGRYVRPAGELAHF